MGAQTLLSREHDATSRARRVDAACALACSSIAPTWPLDRAIAVNPHWKRVGHTVREVAARLASLGGIAVFPPRAEVLSAWRSGRITPADLESARAQWVGMADPPAAEACLAALATHGRWPRLPLLIDVLDNDQDRLGRLSWRQAITHQVSQTCASYFDRWQADWQPERSPGLYAFWRDTLTHDHGVGLLMGLPNLSVALRALPASGREAERWVLQRLDLPEAVWADYLEAVLLSIHGWASWCAWLNWEAGLSGRTDEHLRELLAIRMAWGVIVLECKDDRAASEAFDAVRTNWAEAPALIERTAAAMGVDEIWQLAWEAAYQRELVEGLLASRGSAPQACAVHAVFCIDVRSEPLRHALEALRPDLRTSGFAGFFGLPIAYSPLATSVRRPHLPGLLAPSIEAVDTIEPGAPSGRRGDGRDDGRADEIRAIALRHRHRVSIEAWDAVTRWPAASFSFVEAAGVAYVGKLFRWLLPSRVARARDDLHSLPARYRAICRPVLAGADLPQRIALSEGVLRASGLISDFAPLVLWVGHGSQSANNAQAAALDCGACGGQTGEINARVLVRMLNETAVREGLQARGLHIPPHTVFAALLHNTTTDEVEVFDRDVVPPRAQAALDSFVATWDQASDRTRRWRAPRLGEDATVSPERLLGCLRRRANDGAQTRPEWGLAGNAAFIIAPRHRTRGVALGGRCFLHDYDPGLDPDGGLLDSLMTAPMLVTHWINWQYHASCCEPAVLGSGNKVLHNVVGGQIGVFEGNGGDLRIGLARQSLHDGDRWMHEPLRLTVIIDAPIERIEGVIGKHAIVRDLVDNSWLHLWRWREDGFQVRRAGQWVPCPLEPAQAHPMPPAGPVACGPVGLNVGDPVSRGMD